MAEQIPHTTIADILLATDFSAGAEAAAEQAADLAAHLGARLCVHALGPDDEPEGPALAALDEVRQRCAQRTIHTSSRLVDDPVDEAILDAAADLPADLIVVGSRGRTGFQRFLLGSVAERVVRAARCSVLVARPGSSAAGGYRRVLVATDFSTGAADALAVAAELAAADADIDLLHCWQVPYLWSGTRESIEESSRRMNGDIQSQFERVEAEWSGPATLHCRSVQRPAGHGVQWWLDEHPQDLVVTGNRGRTLRRLLLGSVAEMTVRYSPCSVAVVHD